ncbi:hypothetical protein GGR54DRAFT_630953 [Hypoxylon sp. NC1633]|nr:hypothetical protein GGR54DRAFT_630953 [Hypoxylon sp. NC1633]
MSRPFVSGVAFGAALTAAAVHQPDVIVAQMGFQNWHMVTTFLTASSTSTILVNIFQRLGYLNLNPRNYSTLNLFGLFDGNIIGGWLLGAGMTVSGSCPGTVFAQVGAGVRSGLYTLAGTILGGIIWSGFLRPALHDRTKSNVEATNAKNHPLTLDEWIGMSQISIIASIEILFASMIAVIVYLAPPESGGMVGPVTGGLLITSAQLVSIVMRKSLLGTSRSFEEVGDYFWWTIGRGVRPTSYNAIALTAGMAAGALAVSLGSPASRAIPDIVIGPTRAVIGGFLLAIGARLGGGCTSGHGISGVSLFSISSLVSVVAMFAGGMSVAAIMG